MRVVLSTFGSRGDVHPVLALACALRGFGHSVAVCAPPDFEADATLRGLEFHGIGDPFASQAEEAVGIFAQGRLAASFRRKWDEQVGHHFAVLDPLASDADLLVETSMSITGPTVAESAGIPFRYVALVPTAFPSRYHAPGFLRAESLPLGTNLLAAQLVNAAISKLLGESVTAERRRRGLEVRGALQAWEGVFRHGTPLLAADAQLATLPPDLIGRVLQTGTMRLDSAEQLAPQLDAFLAAGAPPVFVGFGSMPIGDRESMARSVIGALKRTGTRGIVQGLGQVAAPDVDVFSCDSAPHDALFARCSAVVHHGGAGTTFSAASAGVPQVVVPFLADQHYWGRRVAALGVGPRAIDRRHLDRDLADALRVALAPECVDAARALAPRLSHDGARLTAEALGHLE